MKQTMPLGRVAGIRIGAHWSVLVMVVLIGWLLGAQVLPAMTPHEPAVEYWTVAVLGAVAYIAALLAHELAHSLVARRYGVPVTSITLWAFGGVSELGSEPPTARADLRIAAAGPATSLAAASRAVTTLHQVMAAVPPTYVAAPDDPATPLLNRPPLAGDLAAIVLSDGKITGIVTITRLRQIVRRETLRARPGPVTGSAGQAVGPGR